MTTKTQHKQTCSQTNKRPWKRWTEDENAQIIARYATEGTLLNLPGRTREDIRKQAQRLRFRAILAITPRVSDYFEHRWLRTWSRDIPQAPRSVFDLAR